MSAPSCRACFLLRVKAGKGMLEAIRRLVGSMPKRTRHKGEADNDLSSLVRPGYPVLATGNDGAELESPLSVDFCPKNVSLEIEAEMSRLNKNLAAAAQMLDREYEHSQQTDTELNQGAVEAANRRVELIELRMAELTHRQTPTKGDSRRRRRARSKSGTRIHQAKTNNAVLDLGQAVRAALKRGRFGTASERAVFAKITSDLTEGCTEIFPDVLERLGELQSPAAMPVFDSAMGHPNQEVRLGALRGLLAMQRPAVRRTLVEALGDLSHRVRALALQGLHALNDPLLDELFCEALYDPHPQVRRAAAIYLNWNRVITAEPYLKDCLHDEFAPVRVAAANALGQCGSPACCFRLMHALGDQETEVREAAAATLTRILGRPLNIAEDDSPDERAKAVNALKAWWKTERLHRVVSGNS